MQIQLSKLKAKQINIKLIFVLAFSTIFCSIFHKPIILKVLIVLVLLIGTTSCSKDRYIKGVGVSSNSLRSANNFSVINLSLDAEVKLVQDSIYKLEINAQQNITDVIETNIVNNILQIRLKPFTSIRKHDPIIIIVHLPNVNQLDVSGSGSISCQSKFMAENISLNISGSGEIFFNGDIKHNLTSNISGSGSLKFVGNSKCNISRHVVSGSGMIDAMDLPTENCEAIISGSGKVKVNVSKSLSGKISGSGIIEYKGDATSSVSVSGSGKVIHIN